MPGRGVSRRSLAGAGGKNAGAPEDEAFCNCNARMTLRRLSIHSRLNLRPLLGEERIQPPHCIGRDAVVLEHFESMRIGKG